MGEVYLAFDLHRRRRVAIKSILPDAEPEYLERFRREARHIACLDHPAIVRIHELLSLEGGDYLVMEYVEGRSLSEIIADGPLAVSETSTLGCQIALGLAAAHAEGLAHRDLKPGNVIVTPDREAKILDFGLALQLDSDLDSRLTGPQGLVGTAEFMAPEGLIAGSRGIDQRVDLFALGVVFYQMLTTVSPFRDETLVKTLMRILSEDPLPIRQLVPEIPLTLARLVEGLLAKEPEDRPSLADVLRVLRPLARRDQLTPTQPLDVDLIAKVRNRLERRSPSSASS